MRYILNPMTSRARAYLATAVLCSALGLALVTGWINVRNLVSLYVLLPIGAIFFGLFMMANLFENQNPKDTQHSPKEIADPSQQSTSRSP